MGVALNNNKSGFSLEDKFNKVNTGTGNEGENQPYTDTPTHTHTEIPPVRRQAPMKENKSKRLYPLVTPTMAARIHAAAAAQGLSTNDLLNKIFEEYLDREGY